MSYQNLAYYAETGDIDLLNEKLEEGEDPDEFTEAGMNSIHLSAQYGHVKCMKALLEASGDVSIPDKKTGRLPLHWACVKGSTEIVEILLEAGTSIEIKDNDGCTPIMLACANGKAETAITLREMGAKVNIKSKDGSTPLHYAATFGHIDAALAMMARGCYSHTVDNNGDCALVRASRNRFMDLALVMTQKGAYAPCKEIDKALNRTSRVIKDAKKKVKVKASGKEGKTGGRKRRGQSRDLAGSASASEAT
jgi:ankyrin repeat protein